MQLTRHTNMYSVREHPVWKPNNSDFTVKTGNYVTGNQNWIRRHNMKRKAAEEDTETVLPMKKVRLTPWQQYLKNYAKTEGTVKALSHNMSL